MRVPLLPGGLMLGGCIGCAELLGANFDDLEPRLVDASDSIVTSEVAANGQAAAADDGGAASSTVEAGKATPPALDPELGASGEMMPAPQVVGLETPRSNPPSQGGGLTASGAETDLGDAARATKDAGTPGPSLPSSPSDGGATVSDAGARGAGPRRCSSSSPFSRIEPVLGLQVNASRIRLSDDELTGHFAQLMEAPRSLDLFASQRATLDTPFRVARELVGLNQDGFETSPSLTADDGTLYFESGRSGFFRIYLSTRGADGSWSASSLVPDIGVAGFHDGGPYLAPRSGSLYFHSDRTGAGDLYRATRGENGFEVPLPLLGVNTERAESFPLVSADELTLYFVRPESGPLGEHSDLWMATRANELEPFEGARKLTELNTDLAELPDWISIDDCRLYFSRMPVTLWRGSLVYVATREPSPGPCD